MSATQKHVVAFTYQSWGHARPLIHLCARFVKLREVYVTFLVPDSLLDRATSELSRSFAPGEDQPASRLRVVSLGDSAGAAGFNSVDETLKATWEKLCAEEEIVCGKTGTRFSSLSKPQAVILDYFAIGPIHTIRALSGNSVKIYSWMSGAAMGIFYLFGPEQLGGRGNIRLKAEEEAKRTGRSFEEIAIEMSLIPKGEVVKVPSLPPMYDYEYYPQEFDLPREVGAKLLPRIYEALESCDGTFLMSPQSYEPDAVAAVRQWYAETSRQVYVCGPLLPPQTATAAENEKKQSKVSAEIQEFLDKTLKTAGERSLLYMSFGSLFWPKSPEKVWAFLDVVMELNIPFLLSHASPKAVVPEDVKAKVQAYGKGFLSSWSPQQTVLEHPVTGWFLSHGGQNSVIESVAAGVPLILWPFGGDQPVNAIHISEQLQVGYELIEVRTGHGLHPIYRNGRKPAGTIDVLKSEAREVLTKAYGQDGAEKRERLQKLTESVLREWEEGGAALRDATAFLDGL
ncbi:UDP-Glycosyltransferase/glycogen phosphorylase [Pilatotrama ljubarskyi]|nr:UDP-Glycosyltransferase/glycogen phosphorylase [Pilatotrama ljubarskyi]